MVTYSSAFTTPPIVLITSGGDSVSGTTYGSGGNNVEGVWVPKAMTITTTTFTLFLRNGAQTNPGGSGNFFYQWIAIGN